jgi:hypothetical protein
VADSNFNASPYVLSASVMKDCLLSFATIRLACRLDTFTGWRFRASNLDRFRDALEHPQTLFDAELVGSAQAG